MSDWSTFPAPRPNTMPRWAKSGLGPLPLVVENPRVLGISTNKLSDTAKMDEAISEFSRFYLERREQEIKAARGDERKQKKLEDEFTPRLEMTLVALDGKVHREIEVTAQYRIDTEFACKSSLTVKPYTGELVGSPEMGRCAKSGKTVPTACLKQCQISGAVVLQHLLAKSEMSSRLALPEFTVLCSLSGKRVLKDEAEISAVSGRLVASALLKTSALSGKRAEPEHLGRCDFTKAEVLNTELATSELSGRRHRIDEQVRSGVSGKTGHKQEFLICHETRQPVASTEAEQCEVTGNFVRPGILEQCEITQKRALPSELSRCVISNKRVLRTLLVTSNLTGAQMLEKLAVRSIAGKYCAPIEAKLCLWSGRKFHPDDLRVCELTGLTIHFQFATANGHRRLQALVDLLNGIKRTADEPKLWDAVSARISATLKKSRCKVEAAILSPYRLRLAVCAEVRTLLGFRVHQAGLVYAVDDQSIVGRVAQGQRTSEGWSEFR